MSAAMEVFNQKILTRNGFHHTCRPSLMGPLWREWRMDSRLGSGHFFTYEEKDLFDIKIHDFSFREDFPAVFQLPGYLSITYYESVSGEQLNPYRRLGPGCLQCFIGTDTPYHILMHREVPVRSIGIGISPAYYNEYLKARYPDDYKNPFDAFTGLNEDAAFPELLLLLKQIKSYQGNGMAGRLFYESKVTEIISLLVRHSQHHPKNPELTISATDLFHLERAVSCLKKHYANAPSLSLLAQTACMGTTKFKTLFKAHYGCTVTAYVQQEKLKHAQELLLARELTIGEIAHKVGYSTPGHLARAFKEQTGMTPKEYRRSQTDS